MVNRGRKDMNNTLSQLDLTDIYRTLQPTTEYIFFSNAHGTFSRIHCLQGHKTNLSKFKGIEIIQSMFCNHNRMKLDNNGKHLGNSPRHGN
jgi:hypothetical protein